MRSTLIILAAVVLLLLGAALMYVIDAASGLQFAHAAAVSPSEFISIILTALGVILAAVTLLLGALAVVGWASFESLVEKKADAITSKFIQDRFSEDDENYKQFVENVKEDVRVRLLPVVEAMRQQSLAIDPDA